MSRGTEFQRAMEKAPPTPHGTVFGLNDGGEKVGPSRAEAVSGGVVMKEISQVWGCKIVQSFAGWWRGSYPMGSQRCWWVIGLMYSLEWEWVSNWAAEFSTYCSFFGGKWKEGCRGCCCSNLVWKWWRRILDACFSSWGGGVSAPPMLQRWKKNVLVAWLTCDLKERAGSVMMLRFSGRSDWTHINAEGEAVTGGEKEIWTQDDVLHFISVTDNVTKWGHVQVKKNGTEHWALRVKEQDTPHKHLINLSILPLLYHFHPASLGSPKVPVELTACTIHSPMSYPQLISQSNSKGNWSPRHRKVFLITVSNDLLMDTVKSVTSSYI